MQRRNLVVSVLLALALVIGGIALWKGRGAKDGAHAAATRKIAVATVEAVAVDFPVRRQAIGLVESPATVVILSRIDSQMAEQHVHDGQLVKRGDLLFVLDDREIAAAVAKDTATVQKDEALLAQTVSDLHRAQELLSKNSASQQQVDVATTNQKSAEAVLAADKATLDADKAKQSYTRIYAPIAGRVGTVRVTPGNLVKANDAAGGGLVTITQVEPLRVTFALPERDLPLLREATAHGKQPDVAIEAPNSGTRTTGKLNFVDSAVDAASGTIAAKAWFANEQGVFWPGQYVQSSAVLGTMPGAISIPTVAVQMGQKGAYVFVVGANGVIDIRDVTVVAADGQNSAITGLKAGEHVVVEGQNRLTKGSAVNETQRDRDPTAPVSEVQK